MNIAEREATAPRIKRWALAHLPDFLIQRVKKHHYLRLLRRQGSNEEPEFTVISRLVKSGDHVLDVGANYGVYMKFLSGLVGRTGLVVSVEPIPSTFRIISSNARRLRLDNVRLLNVAFSDRNEDAVMEVPRLPTGGENYYMAKIAAGRPDPGLRRVEIKTVTLDSEFASHPTEITFIKCDVEGHELPCVSGAMAVVRTWRPAWCIEVSGDPDRPDSKASSLFRVFERESYRPFWFDGTVLRPRRAGDTSVNYFFLQSRHLENVRDLLEDPRAK
jgi:FkbM family methyltransferase